jgi:signal transduction histidine kinase
VSEEEPIKQHPAHRSGFWIYGLVLLAVCAAIAATGLYGYREINRELTEVALSRRAAVAQLTASTLSEKLARVVDVTVSLATRVRFRELVAGGHFVEASAILHDVPRDFPFVERLFMADADGVLRADVPELPGVRGLDFSHREWYVGVSRRWDPYVSPMYRRTAAPQLDLFAVAAPIRDARQGVAGILVLQVRLDAFFDWIERIGFDRDETLHIVDQRGRAAFQWGPGASGASAEPADLSDVAVVRKVLRGAGGVEIGSGAQGSPDKVIAYAPVSDYGWGVVVQQPRASALAWKDLQLQRLLIAYGLTFMLGLFGLYLWWRVMRERRFSEDEWRVKVQLERMVDERTAQLAAANRELESFSYSVSHDLRSPLRAIDGFSRILEEDYGDKLDDEARSLIGVVRENTARMSQLIDDLLAFSRLGRKALDCGPIDMTALAQEVYRELPHLENEPAFDLTALPTGWGDRALVRQVWENLLSNARKFSSRSPGPRIEVRGREEADGTVYSVRDNGAGFDMKYYDKVFGVFQRLHPESEFPGTGVGLAIVQRVISRHGGHVWGESAPGEGATFHFTLPKGPPHG